MAQIATQSVYPFLQPGKRQVDQAFVFQRDRRRVRLVRSIPLTQWHVGDFRSLSRELPFLVRELFVGDIEQIFGMTGLVHPLDQKNVKNVSTNISLSHFIHGISPYVEVERVDQLLENPKDFAALFGGPIVNIASRLILGDGTSGSPLLNIIGRQKLNKPGNPPALPG